jgi:hypothetical protein
VAYQPQGPRGPSIIHWPVVAAAGAAGLLFMAGLTVAAWRGSHAGRARETATTPAAVAAVQAPTPPPSEEPPPADPQPPAASPAEEENELPPTTAGPSLAEVDSLQADPAPATPPVPRCAPATETHGTRVDFVALPAEASRLAVQEDKLLFVLHLSGNFEDPQFT